MRGECHLCQCQHLFGRQLDLLRRGDLQPGGDVWWLADMRRRPNVRIRASDVRRFAHVRNRANLSGGSYVRWTAYVRWFAHLCAGVHLQWLADLPGATV